MNNVFYYFSDHLGTSRAIAQSGQTILCYDADFFPFGGEKAPVVDNCPQNYKFTGKERDSQSGSDYFFARYYGSSIARFLSPDSFGGHLEDPQTLNRYAYVGNNPLVHTDQDGKDVNHNSLDLAGSGDLKGFNFHVDGNCGGTCLSSGEWRAPGMTLAQAREALYPNSFHIPGENLRAGLGFGDHPYSTQFRFGGTTLGCASSPCPNTPHLSVPFDPAGSFPKYTIPAAGGWHVDAHSGWSAHNQDINNTH